MNSKKFSEAMSELDSKYVDEAISYKKKAKKPVWAKWGAIAACFVAVTVLGVGLFQSGLFGSHTDIATLNNGEKIVFVRSDNVGGSLASAVRVCYKISCDYGYTVDFRDFLRSNNYSIKQLHI